MWTCPCPSCFTHTWESLGLNARVSHYNVPGHWIAPRQVEQEEEGKLRKKSHSGREEGSGCGDMTAFPGRKMQFRVFLPAGTWAAVPSLCCAGPVLSSQTGNQVAEIMSYQKHTDLQPPQPQLLLLRWESLFSTTKQLTWSVSTALLQCSAGPRPPSAFLQGLVGLLACTKLLLCSGAHSIEHPIWIQVLIWAIHAVKCWPIILWNLFKLSVTSGALMLPSLVAEASLLYRGRELPSPRHPSGDSSSRCVHQEKNMVWVSCSHP